MPEKPRALLAQGPEPFAGSDSALPPILTLLLIALLLLALRLRPLRPLALCVSWLPLLVSLLSLRHVGLH